MKKRNLLPMLLFAILIPMFAFAGETGIPEWVTWVITALAFVIGLFIPATGQGKFVIIKSALLGAIKLLDEILDARHPDSDGGKKITEKEWKEVIYPTLETVANSLKSLFPMKK